MLVTEHQEQTLGRNLCLVDENAAFEVLGRAVRKQVDNYSFVHLTIYKVTLRIRAITLKFFTFYVL